METDKLKEVVDLAGKTDYVFIATADAAGVPHIAAAGRLEQAGQDCLTVSEWFCPGTLKNLQTNHTLSLVAWDRDTDAGFQLLGHLRSVKSVGVLDGILHGIEHQPPLPQEEKQLRIQIDRILNFKRGPHSDVDMQKQNKLLFTDKK